MCIIAIILIVGLLILAFLSYTSCVVSCKFYLANLCRNPNAKGKISISFDDGVDAIYTPQVLDLLAEYNAKATFFIIGEKAKAMPDIVKKIIEQGHEIGNHSYRHKWNFALQSTSKISLEVSETQSVLEEITAKKIRLFRAPFGFLSPMLARAIKKRNLVPVAWSIRSFDTIHSPEKVKLKVRKQLRAGEVILFHDNRENIVEILDFTLALAKKKSLKCVTISQLFDL